MYENTLLLHLPPSNIAPTTPTSSFSLDAKKEEEAGYEILHVQDGI